MIKRLVQRRRDLHRIPELGFDLPKTRDYVVSALKGLPCEIIPIGGASLCAFFDAGKPESIAFRSDMDALPISERNSFGHASGHPGMMHACGHDGHMSILLALAEEIAARLGSLPCNALLVFQAAEETTGGAREICESGVFERHDAKKVFGLHLWPDCPRGCVSCRSGEFMASTRNMQIDISGRGAHAAKADKGIDALLAGTLFVARAYAMERGELAPGISRLLKFCSFQSGTGVNIISGHTAIRGTMRCFQDEVSGFMSDRMREIAAEIDRELGCVTEIGFLEGYPAVINDAGLLGGLKEALAAPLGAAVAGLGAIPFIEQELPSMTAEDFSFYQRRLPGLFFHLGMGTEAPLHSDTFDIDESVLPIGVEIFMRLLLAG
ncbi:MAG: amidohydrolase [Clostridiales Family XIII bacterium]|jgi:hippurate hydrolase|nr:amidohydrolase [Clostridiales Family XIII bacterium]